MLPLKAAIETVEDIEKLLNKTADWLFTFLLVFAVMGILYGGFTYAAAGGDTEKLTKARWIVIGSLIGAAVGILSKTILKVITSYLS